MVNYICEEYPVKISFFEDKTWFLYKDQMWITNDDYKITEMVVEPRNEGEGAIGSFEVIGKYKTDEELINDAKNLNEAETLFVSEEIKYLIEEQERKKEKRIKRAKRAIEGPDDSEIDERSRAISTDVQDRVWNRDGGKCVQCGSNENLEFDHIIPFSKGGANTYRNIQLLCESCNRSKSDKIG